MARRPCRCPPISLSVSLPIGVEGATIVVPKRTKDGEPSAAASITLDGREIWDGAKLVDSERHGRAERRRVRDDQRRI